MAEFGRGVKGRQGVAGGGGLGYAFIMIRAQVSLEAEMYQAAREEAMRQGISFAEFCRQALAQVLERTEEDKPWMRFSGILEGDDPDASLSVNDVVYNRERL